MASPASLLKAILNVKEVVFLNADTQSVERTRFDDIYEETSFLFDVRPYKKSESICHLCGRVCPRFDQGNYEEARCWLVLIGGSQGLPSVQNPSRCLPWTGRHNRFGAFGIRWFPLHEGLRFHYHLAGFEAVKDWHCFLHGHDWKTVGYCIRRTLNQIELDQNGHLKKIVNIGVDETSFRKGHKYITVVVNHDINFGSMRGTARRFSASSSRNSLQRIASASRSRKSRI